jgi:hypothetical protein
VDFSFQKVGDVVIKSKGRAHIMMVYGKTS